MNKEITKTKPNCIRLPKIEVAIYFIIWISTIIYFLYKVYTAGNRLNNDEIYFEAGWQIIGKFKDISDYEWSIWINYIIAAYPWIIFHFVLTQLCRLIILDAIPICHCVTTLLFLYNYVNDICCFIVIIEVLIYYLCLIFCNSVIILWIINISLLIFMHSANEIVTSLPFHDLHITTISAAWLQLRCHDFLIIEFHSYNKKSFDTFLNMIGYVFYFPSFIFGPFIPYNDFKLTLYNEFNLNKKKLINFGINLGRYCLWLCLYIISSHYFYCNALIHSDNLHLLDCGTLHGIGYCMGQFFHLKYIVIYGLSRTIAVLDGHKAPPPPKCINRIHLYSNMWRHFDRGFYLFIFNNIFVPFCQTNYCSTTKRIIGSFLCFCFVYIWHGSAITFFYWSFLNFFGISLETFGKLLIENKIYQKFENKYLISRSNVRRFRAFVSAPVWILAVISNLIFFGGHDFGFLFFKQFISGSLLYFLIVGIVSYSVCQVSVEIDLWESKNK